MESTTAIILGYLGVALMVGLSGVASCIGTSIAGMASVGAMKKNGGAFGSYMILSAIPLSLIHISETTRLRRISYAVFCLKKKKHKKTKQKR